MGMVGGGVGAFMGAVHRSASALDGQFEMVCGAFNRDASKNVQTGQSLGIPEQRVYDSWRQLIYGEANLPPNERMEVLVIVTPNHLHANISEAAINAGFHVFCEKPASITLAEAQKVAQALETSDRLYGLAHTYLGYPMVWQAREMVLAGDLGRLRKIYVEYPQGWMSERQEAEGDQQAAWRSDPARAGVSGCMADIGTHAFGMAEFVSGQRITELCGELRAHLPGRRLDDDGVALFHTSEDASGVLMASQVCVGEENALKIRLYGDKGGLEWHQMEPNSLLHRRLGEPPRMLRAGIDQPRLYPAARDRCRLPGGHPEGYLEAMGNLYQSFACAVRQGMCGSAPGVPGIAEGLRGMAFIETIVESQKSDRKWLPIPDVG